MQQVNRHVANLAGGESDRAHFLIALVARDASGNESDFQKPMNGRYNAVARENGASASF
jgi:hypothetical protein